jgi:23S rRNA (adenine2503-C2)-methyltransferase
MPINKKYPLRELVAALKKYPLPPRRRITVEYTMVHGENDSDDDARRLIKLLRDLKVKINLIPMNPVAGSPLSAPQMQRVFAFQELLAATGLSVFVRRRRGDDVAAACGQLALAGAKPTNRAIKKLGMVKSSG